MTVAFALAAALQVGAPEASPPGGPAVVVLGAGSYRAAPPAGVPQPPAVLFRTAACSGPMPTNDWWSSLAWERFSANQFPHPLAVRAAPEGLVVWYPGTALVATERAVVGPVREDLVLTAAGAAPFADTRVGGFSDWFVTAAFASERAEARLEVTYGHGSPFVFARVRGARPALTLGTSPVVWAGSEGASVLGLSVNGAHYGVFGASSSSWTGVGTRRLENRGDADFFSVALLPDASVETLRFFATYAHRHVTDSRVSWKYEPRSATVKTEFRFTTEAREAGSEGSTGTLFALYPHQWSATGAPLTPHRYRSIRGEMRVGAGASFVTRVPLPPLLPFVPVTEASDAERLRELVRAVPPRAMSDARDSYWDGKNLGAYTDLAALADQLEGARRVDLELRARLEDWLTVEEGEAARFFYYNADWGTAIGSLPSYGSDTHLTDHHFHYGYFIRAAAELARQDPEWGEPQRWGRMVDWLVDDVASSDRADPRFPFLRNFDPYAGGYWASGHAGFGDGNNQESSSEAIQAWAAIALWGAATGRTEMRDRGLYLFATEVAAAEEYWFDVHERTLPAGYGNDMAALIWGGKLDYGTWFSAKPEHVQGIVLLPIHSGSLYLGRHPEYVPRFLANLGRRTGRGAGGWSEWHDVFSMYAALDDADSARRYFDRDFERMPANRRAHALAWIEMFRSLGALDATVTADDPFAAVFRKEGRRTYVLYNVTDAARVVTFSTGRRVRAAPRQLTLATD